MIDDMMKLKLNCTLEKNGADIFDKASDSEDNLLNEDMLIHL